MRTVKASEVRKGMRVRVEQRFTHPPLVKGGAEDETIDTIEGTVTVSANANITFANGDTRYLGYEHPVTVLAEPEPEWVEGAWYWTLAASQTTPRIRKRMERGWGSVGVDGTNTVWLDNGAADITVLGRVLIVDWPGDDAARELVEAYSDGDDYTIPANQMAVKVADAIRTQGGAR